MHDDHVRSAALLTALLVAACAPTSSAPPASPALPTVAPAAARTPAAPAGTAAPAVSGPTCSPPGTATCDGQGRPIVPGGGAPPPGVAAPPGGAPPGGVGGGAVATGVRLIEDVGLRVVKLSSGGTNGLDVDPATGLVYAVSNSTVGAWCGRPVGTRRDLLSVVDPVEAREIAAIPTVRAPVWPLAAGTGSVVYVAGSDGVIGIHDRASRAQTGSIAVGGLPHDLGYDATSGYLLVSNTYDQSQDYVSVVDTRTRTVVAAHRVGGMPHKIVVDTATRRAYVMSVGNGRISVVDMSTGALERQIDSGGGGTLAVSPRVGRAFATGRVGAGADTIRVVDLRTGQGTTTTPFLAMGGHPVHGMAVDDAAGLLYASLGDSDLVGVADVTSLRALAVFRVADCAWGVKLDPERGRGYVTGAAEGTVSVFDLRKVSAALGR